MNIFKRRKRVHGKLVESRTWYGRFRVAGMSAPKVVNLDCTNESVALRRLTECISDAEKEAAGMLPPRLQRESYKVPLSELLADFVSDLKARDLSPVYITQASARPLRVFKECRWNRLSDINPHTFTNWLNRLKNAPKTKHGYQTILTRFLKWLVSQGRATHNPLTTLPPCSKKAVRDRRAYTPEEVGKLLTGPVPDYRRRAYLLACSTGLRRAELHALRWDDFKSQGDEHWLAVRGDTTKNGKDAVIPLPFSVAAELVEVRTLANPRPKDPIFRRGLPNNYTLRRDLVASGINPVDQLGRSGDFHAFRKTYCTFLQLAGVSPRVAQELMRHSDPKLTQCTYTDASQLPLRPAVDMLSQFVKVTKKVTTKHDISRHLLTQHDKSAFGLGSLEPQLTEGIGHELAQAGMGLQKEKDCGERESNPRF